jgi:hypothetical protein
LHLFPTSNVCRAEEGRFLAKPSVAQHKQETKLNIIQKKKIGISILTVKCEKQQLTLKTTYEFPE